MPPRRRAGIPHKSEPEPEPEPEPQPAPRPCSSPREPALDLADEAIRKYVARSRSALDAGTEDGKRRALDYLTRARDLALSQIALGQGRAELHVLALLRFVEEAAAEPAVVGAPGGVAMLVEMCDKALARYDGSGANAPMAKGRLLGELSQLLLKLPPTQMDRASMDRATQSRRESKKLIAEAEAQLAALATVHQLEEKVCDVVPEEFAFTAEEQSLTRIVAASGISDWASLANEMNKAHPEGRSWSAADTESAWDALAPRVRDILESNPTMGVSRMRSACFLCMFRTSV